MSHRPWGPKAQEGTRRILKRLTARPRAAGEVAEWLLPLREDEQLTVSGPLELRIVRGCVELWGAVLTPTGDVNRFTLIQTPPWAAVPTLCAVGADYSMGNSTAPSAAEKEDAAVLLRHSWPTILCVRAPPTASKCPVLADSLVRRALSAPVSHPRLRVHRAWHSISERFGDLCLAAAAAGGHPSGSPPVLLVTGPKGAGKSSFCRFFVNTLLKQFEEVCFLETDLGQPELGPPGVVCVHSIRQPLLQPPHAEQFLHQRIAGFFAGGTTPALNPTLFVRCVRAAFDAHIRFYKNRASGPPPLIVNTHGWAAGFGLELVRAILGITRAQVVVRIRPGGNATPEGVAATSPAEPPAKRRRTALSRCGPMSMELDKAAGLDEADSGLPGIFVTLEPAASSPSISKASSEDAAASEVPIPADSAVAKPLQVTLPSMKAADLRWLRLACYFRPDMDPCSFPAGLPAGNFFRPVPRMRLPLHRLRFGLLHGPLASQEVPAAFTGTVVFLCRCALSHNGLGEGARTQPVILDEPDSGAPEFLAAAFVHSFDVARGELVVHCPQSALSVIASEENGEESLAVLRGDMRWEPQGSSGECSAALCPQEPYCAAWALRGLGAGARVLSTRRSVLRRRLPKVRS